MLKNRWFFAIVICAAALIAAFFYQGSNKIDDIDYFALDKSELTKLHEKHAHAVGSSLKDMRTTALDLADDTHRAYYLSSLAMAGITPQKAPQLHRVIKRQIAEHQARLKSGISAFAQGAATCSDPQTSGGDMVAENSANYLAGITYENAQQYQSAAVSSTQGGTISTTMYLAQHDAATGALIGNPSNLYDTQKLPFYSLLATGASTAPEAYALYQHSYVDNNGHPHGPCVQRLSTRSLKADINNLAPSISQTQRQNGTWNNIKICINRNPGSFGCRYGPYNVQNPNQMVSPVQATVTYPGSVDMTGGVPTDANVTLIVTRNQVPTGDEAGGGCTAFGPNSEAFFTASTTTWSDNNTVLNFNFQPTYFNSASCNFKNGDQLVYTLVMQVFIDQEPTTVTVTSIKTKPPNPQPATDYQLIPYLQIQSGCLAPGTMVELIDGSQMMVDDPDIEHKTVVAGTDLRELTVFGHTDGYETNPLVVLTTDNGYKLRLTKSHPVIMSDGTVRRAESLSAGDMVKTKTGVGSLTSVTSEPYEGPVYNLSVGFDGEDFTADSRTFFAGGILVGDQNMQSDLVLAEAAHPENRLKTLPAEWHQDYLNFHGPK